MLVGDVTGLRSQLAVHPQPARKSSWLGGSVFSRSQRHLVRETGMPEREVNLPRQGDNFVPLERQSRPSRETTSSRQGDDFVPLERQLRPARETKTFGQETLSLRQEIDRVAAATSRVTRNDNFPYPGQRKPKKIARNSTLASEPGSRSQADGFETWKT